MCAVQEVHKINAQWGCEIWGPQTMTMKTMVFWNVTCG